MVFVDRTNKGSRCDGSFIEWGSFGLQSKEIACNMLKGAKNARDLSQSAELQQLSFIR